MQDHHGDPEPPERPVAARDGAPTNGSIGSRAAIRDPELFPLGTLDGDPERTVRNLLAAHVPVEYTASLMSAEVPLLGGLLDLESAGQALVSWQPAKVEVVPQRDDGVLVGAKVRQKLRPTLVRPAAQMFTLQQVVDLMSDGGVPGETISELLGTV